MNFTSCDKEENLSISLKQETMFSIMYQQSVDPSGRDSSPLT